MKLRILASILTFAALATSATAASFYFTRGQSGAASYNRNVYNLANWAKSRVDWNTNPATAFPGAYDSVYLSANSGYNGSTWTGNNGYPYMELNKNIELGAFYVDNQNNIPLTISGGGTVLFNSVRLSSLVYILNKDRNTDKFRFAVGMNISSKGASTVIIKNNSDADLEINAPIKVLADNNTTYTTFKIYMAQRRPWDQWTAFESGDVVINSTITVPDGASMEFYSDRIDDKKYSTGAVYLQGIGSNITGILNVKTAMRLYLNQKDGVAIDGVSEENAALNITLRSQVTLLRNEQIGEKVKLVFRTPVRDSTNASQLGGILDLNGFSETVGNISFYNDNVVTSGVIGVIDFGDGGAQYFMAKEYIKPHPKVNESKSWFEFKNYRLDEDHVYMIVPIVNYTNLIRFPDLGVHGTDYTVGQRNATVNGQQVTEYYPIF